MASARREWKSQMKIIFEELMRTCRFDSVASLDDRIRSLGAECTLLEAAERNAWGNLQILDCFSELAAVQTNRKVKNWSSASDQLRWILEKQPHLYPYPVTSVCTSLWCELEAKHREREKILNLRYFHEDLESSMNLDNCFNMEDWELVKGGDTGRNTSQERSPHVGVFKAKSRDNKMFAVKCVYGRNPDEIKSMKREVESHSILLHPCVLQYSGDYTISSSHFLKFIWKETTSLDDFSAMYSLSRQFLFIVSEFCSGGNMFQYVHGARSAQHEWDMNESAFTSSERCLPLDADGSEAFLCNRSHHLYLKDYILMFDHACQDVPYLAVVTKVDTCPVNYSDPQLFWIRRVPASESLVQQYVKDSFPSLDCFPDVSHYFNYVCLDETCSQLYRTLPRPGFAFLRNFCFQAIHSLWACSLQSLYHGDVRLENVFLRNVVEIDEVLGDDDQTCCSVGVQLGDFDLTTPATDRAEELSKDRHQLVVALLVLVDGSKGDFGKYIRIHRNSLDKIFGRKKLEYHVRDQNFCKHLPEKCRIDFGNFLLGLWDAEDRSKTPSFAILKSFEFFSSVPDVVGLHQSVTEMSASQHYLGDSFDASHLDIEEQKKVQKEAQKIISFIRDECHGLEFATESPESFCVSDVQLQRLLKTIQGLCLSEKRNDCQLLHPGTCRVFLRCNLCAALGSAVTKLMRGRRYLGECKLRLEREAEWPTSQAKAHRNEQLEKFSGSLRCIDEIENLIMLILEQCAGHREIKSLMFFSSNDELISFLSMQVDHPKHHLSGNKAPLSLFVQMFAFSDPGYPDITKFGSCKPIFDTQTKLESLITYSLFEKVQQTCVEGSRSVLLRIFQFAFDMMESFARQTSIRDKHADITSSEQNLNYAFCALVNISVSFRWCIESNVSPNPYTLANSCVNCELNTHTSHLFCKLLSFKEAISKMRLRDKFGARMSHLISEWWFRMERPLLCSCGHDKVIGNEDLKTVKKIISPHFLNLPGASRMFPGLQAALSSVQSSSPEDSPKCAPKVPTESPPLLEVGRARISSEPRTPLERLEVCGVFSRNRVSSPKVETSTETPKILTCHEQILHLLKTSRGVLHKPHFENDSCECEIDLTELDGEPPEQFEGIMKAAAEDLPPNCGCSCFTFIMCKGVQRRHKSREDVATVACIGTLVQDGLELSKKMPCREGTFCWHYDSDRQYQLLTVCPHRKTAVVRGGHKWLSVDGNGVQRLGDEPVCWDKPLIDCARRAALRFWKQPWFRSQSQITVQIFPRDVDFEETFSRHDLKKKVKSRPSSGGAFDDEFSS